jgi:hypothetical protein
MHLRTCGSVKSANHKKWFRKSQFRKVPHFRKAAKLTKYISPQNCGFAIIGIYLWTTNLRIICYITFAVNMCKTITFFV